MDREELDGLCEKGILALVLAALVFGPLAFAAVDPIPFLIVEALVLAATLVWIARMWLRPRQLLWPPISWGVLVFAGYVAVRYFKAPVEYVARGELIQVIIYALLFLVIVNNLHRQEATHIIVCTLVSLAMLISFYALFQYVTNSQRVWNVFTPYQHRGTGTFINANHLGGFLEMILPLGLAFTLASRFKALGRIFLGYSACVIIAGIAVTVSRGAWLASGISFVMFFLVLASIRAYRIPAIALMALILMGGVFLIPKSRFVVRRAAQLYQNGRIDDDKRFDLWQPAVEIWRENKVWGAGPAHYNTRFRMYRPESVQRQPDHAHNDYLDALADYGIAGLVIIGGALASLAVAMIGTWRKVRPASRDIGQKPGSNKFALVLGATTGLVAIVLHSVVDFNMHIPANAMIAVTLMALLSGYARFWTDRLWVRRNLLLQIACTIIGLGVLAGLATAGIRTYHEQLLLTKAHRAPLFSAQQVEWLAKAFAVEPKNPATAIEIAEAARRRAQEGGRHYDEPGATDYLQYTTNSLAWFRKAATLDPYNADAWLGQGWCLDWLGYRGESPPMFSKAEEMDPNGSFTIFRIGLHYMEQAQFAAARPWFERSLRLEGGERHTAAPYLQVADKRLLEAGTNDLAAELLRFESGAKAAIINR